MPELVQYDETLPKFNYRLVPFHDGVWQNKCLRGSGRRKAAAEKSGRSIVVEVKTFGGPSRLADLEQALGQFALYRTILKRVSPERILFLAIADDVVPSVWNLALPTGMRTSRTRRRWLS
ncbi:MAG: element excision factor XisH family protein [Planctomycetota bacterium]|nr:element excision factor XisH family protein [Planctomycetota bacterium]